MTGTQTGGVLVLVLVTISLLATAASWRSTGIIHWRNVVTSVGIGLLGVALVVGSSRPILFSVLVTLSLILVIVTLVVRFV
jgi:hypothetical protein